MDVERLSVEALVAISPAVIAYWLNRRHTDKQVKQQARNAYIRSIIEKIEEVDKKAGRYYLLAGNTPAAYQLGVEINSDVGNIGRKVNSIGKTIKDHRSILKQKMVSFRQTITGGSFQSACRQPLGRDAQEIASLRLATNDLATALEELLVL